MELLATVALAIAGAELARAIVKAILAARAETAAASSYISRVQSNGPGTGAYWTL